MSELEFSAWIVVGVFNAALFAWCMFRIRNLTTE